MREIIFFQSIFCSFLSRGQVSAHHNFWLAAPKELEGSISAQGEVSLLSVVPLPFRLALTTTSQPMKLGAGGHHDLGQVRTIPAHSLRGSRCLKRYLEIFLLKVPSKALFAKLKAKEPEPAAMSKSEIQSWLNSTASPSSPGEESDEGLGWKRDRVLCDWEKSLEYAQDKLLRGKTKLRVEFLREELLSLAKHAGGWVLPS